MFDNFSLIPGEAFTAGAAVVNNVIDKLEKACGFVATPKGKRKDMEEAVSWYIEKIKNDTSMPDLVKAARISNARKEIKEYCNQNDIINIGINNMIEGSDASILDDDWLNYFMDRAKNVDSEQLKVIWGKLLAEEVTYGGITKKLLHILSIISSDDAQMFGEVCRYYVNFKGFKDSDGMDGALQIFDVKKIGLTSMLRLASLGLIECGSGGAGTFCSSVEFNEGEEKAIVLEYFGETIKITLTSNQIKLGVAALTDEGEALRKILQVSKVDNLLEDIAKQYK